MSEETHPELLECKTTQFKLLIFLTQTPIMAPRSSSFTE